MKYQIPFFKKFKFRYLLVSIELKEGSKLKEEVLNDIRARAVGIIFDVLGDSKEDAQKRIRELTNELLCLKPCENRREDVVFVWKLQGVAEGVF